MNSHAILRLVLLTIVFTIVGCQKVGDAVVAPAVDQAQDAGVAQDLSALFMAYSSHLDYHGQGPAGWDELRAFATEQNLDRRAIERLRAQNYQVTWSMRLQDATDGTMNTVLASAPGKPTLMLDGSVVQE